jgi:hypothetical protein
MDLVLMFVCCFSMTGFFTFSNSIVPGSSHVHVLEMFSIYIGLSNKEKMKKCVEFFAMSVTFCHVSIWNHFDAYYMYTIAWHLYTRSCGNWHELALLVLLHDWRREIGFLARKTCFFPGVLQLSQTDRLNSDGEVIVFAVQCKKRLQRRKRPADRQALGSPRIEYHSEVLRSEWSEWSEWSDS